VYHATVGHFESEESLGKVTLFHHWLHHLLSCLWTCTFWLLGQQRMNLKGAIPLCCINIIVY